MPANICTFQSRKALATIDKITAYLKDCGDASTSDFVEVTGHAQQQVSLYLRHMKKQGLIVCTEPAVFHHSGSVAARWALAPGAEELDADLASRDDFPRKVIVRKEWEPHLARSRFGCYLFGVPPALAGMAS